MSGRNPEFKKIVSSSVSGGIFVSKKRCLRLYLVVPAWIVVSELLLSEWFTCFTIMSFPENTIGFIF
jgi:hypothetical protein